MKMPEHTRENGTGRRLEGESRPASPVVRPRNTNQSFNGGDTVADREAETINQAVGRGAAPGDRTLNLPRPNQPGVEMIQLEACRNQIRNCRNLLIETDRKSVV